MKLAVAYARLAASPDFAEQTKLAALRAEHRKQLTDTQAKHDAEISRDTPRVSYCAGS